MYAVCNHWSSYFSYILKIISSPIFVKDEVFICIEILQNLVKLQAPAKLGLALFLGIDTPPTPTHHPTQPPTQPRKHPPKKVIN